MYFLGRNLLDTFVHWLAEKDLIKTNNYRSWKQKIYGEEVNNSVGKERLL